MILMGEAEKGKEVRETGGGASQDLKKNPEQEANPVRQRPPQLS